MIIIEFSLELPEDKPEAQFDPTKVPNKFFFNVESTGALKPETVRPMIFYSSANLSSILFFFQILLSALNVLKQKLSNLQTLLKHETLEGS